MLYFRLAFRNIARNSRRNALLASLIALCVAASLFVESVFSRTNQGMEISFRNSLTADYAFAAASEEEFGVFGNETPIVKDMSRIEPIPLHEELRIATLAVPGVEAVASQVSGAALLQVGGASLPVAVFGVDLDEYVPMMSGIRFPEHLPDTGKGFVLVNETKAKELEAALGRPLELGEPITLAFASNGRFRIKKAPFGGVHHYAAPSEALNRVVLVDPLTARYLIDYTLGYQDSKRENSTEYINIDSLFDEPVESRAASEALDLASIEALLKGDDQDDSLQATDSGAWSFLLVKLSEGVDRAKVEKELRGIAEASPNGLRLLGWRTAAGLSAQTIIVVQGFFFAGLVLIAFAAAIIASNSLIVSVIERTGEIGSMRALGASKIFVARVFMLESLILVTLSGLLGIVIGSGVAASLAESGLKVNNRLLVSVFGSDTFLPQVSVGSILLHLAGVFVVGALAWVYPAAMALRVPPLAAMAKGAR